MNNQITERINKFIKFTKSLDGYEKGEAQTFLNRLFQAFGHADCHDAGAIFEKRTKVGKRPNLKTSCCREKLSLK